MEKGYERETLSMEAEQVECLRKESLLNKRMSQLMCPMRSTIVLKYNAQALTVKE